MSSLGNNVTKVNAYRKISNLEVPFWGLTKNRIEQLFSEPEDFYVRFDYTGGSITLTSEQIEKMLSQKKPAADGDYKICLSDLLAIFPIAK